MTWKIRCARECIYVKRFSFLLRKSNLNYINNTVWCFWIWQGGAVVGRGSVLTKFYRKLLIFFFLVKSETISKRFYTIFLVWSNTIISSLIIIKEQQPSSIWFTLALSKPGSFWIRPGLINQMQTTKWETRLFSSLTSLVAMKLGYMVRPICYIYILWYLNIETASRRLLRETQNAVLNYL